jgi:lactoylglutathione lyase
MKVLGGCLVAVSAIAAVSALGEAPSAPKPHGMSLRLELFVSDVEKSAGFYTKVLAFERLEGEADYVPVRSESVVIGLGPAAGLSKAHYFNPELQSSRRGLGAEIVLEVDDVQAAYRRVQTSGYKTHLSPLRKQPWGATDFRLVDPDGYYLRVTSR